jgi:hypothetical protein
VLKEKRNKIRWVTLKIRKYCNYGMKKYFPVLKYFFLAFLLGLIAWWATLTPSNQRDWQTDVAILPYATIDNNKITVHRIRNFEYRSETDYTPGYYDKQFDLNKLESVDLIATYWMGPSIAHTFLSFGFGDHNYLAISIETRKEKSEKYSTLKGFFRQYELYYVVADERDVIRLRTNYRRNPPEQVYIYRVKGEKENIKKVFLEYIHKMNQLKSQPEFYNSLTTNCTTNIWANTLVISDHLPFNWKILASGYLPDFLYETGHLETHGLPFSELQKRSNINARAQATDKAIDFSSHIREK